MQRFYVNMTLAEQQVVNLPSEVVRHIQVLRLNEHDCITLFNGDGYDYQAKFFSWAKRQIEVEIATRRLGNTEAMLSLTVYMSIISNDKFDLVIQKAVELGVTRLVPIFTQRTQRFSSDKIKSRLEHWQKIIIAASEQCGRSKLMQLVAPMDLALAFAQLEPTTVSYILSPHHQGDKLPTHGSNIAIFIGPEGGFSDSEIQLAQAKSLKILNLGPRILRAETAAISSISLCQFQMGDLN
ncbi:MAG: hypothetical protein RLZZ293_1387 [Pseudomonadota bacterium]|jgi:16S rRNA (uracil1498-N3)-methyltransferase